MDEYGDVENDATAATAATAATTEGQEHVAPHQNLQIARQLGLEAEIFLRSQLVNLGVLKATKGNATKRLKVEQEVEKQMYSRSVIILLFLFMDKKTMLLLKRCKSKTTKPRRFN